jgi:hypothetical protein
LLFQHFRLQLGLGELCQADVFRAQPNCAPNREGSDFRGNKLAKITDLFGPEPYPDSKEGSSSSVEEA